MRRLVATLVALALLSFGSKAGAEPKVCVATVPDWCKVQDSEFSTGGGENSWVLEVGCRDSRDGGYVKLLTWYLSAGGFLGIGRITAPRIIEFKKAPDRKTLDLDC